MHVPRLALRLVYFGFLATFLVVASAAADEAKTPGEKQTLCELHVQGTHLKSFELEGRNGSKTICEKPGKILHLPPGEYRVTNVWLEGDYRSRPGRSGNKSEAWFELTPERPHTIKVGAPLLPTARVTRQGSFLDLEYDLVDGEGRSYRLSSEIAPGYPQPPRFAVYQGDEKIGSGSFEYG
ncbi:MAG: hypothetical protein JW888_02080 [Pirellulales bacterium]|nr:hypothetical protein [Pirellulales bacterium]